MNDSQRTFFVTSVTWQRMPIFRVEARARLLIEVLLGYRDQGKYLLHEFVVMPDHLHLLLTPAPEISLERAVQFIKGGYSYRLRKVEKIQVWQESFTNHRILDFEDYQRHGEYVRMNPVRAGLVRDARAHGVLVRPVDVAISDWDCTLERRDDGRPALRLGLRVVKHLSQEGVERLLAARAAGAFADIADLAERAALDRRDLEALAAADALAALAGHRHRAVWQVSGVERALPLLPAATAAQEGMPLLRAPREGQEIVADYFSTGLTLRRHPLALLRDALAKRGVIPNQELWELPDGRLVTAAGLVITRQRPGSASGVTFVTMEDETGHVNLIVWKRVADTQRAALLESRLLLVRGKLQREGDVLHVIAQRLTDLSELLGDLTVASRNFH